MKNTLITHATSQEIVVDGKAMLSLSVAKFAEQVTLAVDEMATVYGHTTNRVIGSLSGAMRRELNRYVYKADGAVSASMSAALMNKEAGKVKELSKRVQAVADWAEELFDNYKPYADILAGLSSFEVEFHPFQRQVARTFEVNNELDAEEHDEYTFDESEDYMDDMASLWLEEQSLIADMSQAELRTQKVNVTQAMDSEPQFEKHNITKEEWVEDRVHRKPDEWYEASRFSAWDAIAHVMEEGKKSPHYPLVVETIGEMPEKKLGYATKVMRKAIDMELRIDYLESRKVYIQDQIHKMDNTSEELTIAAMSNSFREDEIDELDMNLRDARKVYNFLAHQAEQFEQWLSLVQLDTPHRVYSSYVAFDPVEFMVNQMIKKAGYQGERVSPRALTQFQKDAYKMLGNPTTIESFKLEDGDNAGLELWGIHFTSGAHDELKDAARSISKVRAIKNRHDELGARAEKLDKIVKSAAMRNKKPTSPFELEAITKKFLF